MAGAKVYLRPDARRWEFIEEFSHWRMRYGDRFLAREKRLAVKLVNRLGTPLSKTAAEEIAVKSYLINNRETLGLEEVDVNYLKHQIATLWKYGAEHY